MTCVEAVRLPADALIPDAKIRDYLLVPLPEDDKSGWLAGAGYRREEWKRLRDDIRSQLLTLPAVPDHTDPHGVRYVARGVLVGPSGLALRARCVWIRRAESGVVSFVTLVPDRKS